ATARGDGARAPGPVSSGVELASSWISVPDAAPFGAEVHAAVKSWVAGHVPDDTAEAHPVMVDPAPAPAAVVGTIQARLAADLAMHEQHRRVALVRRPPQADRGRIVHARHALQPPRCPVQQPAPGGRDPGLAGAAGMRAD